MSHERISPSHSPASPIRGVGIGLRAELASELLERPRPEVDFLEIHPENYMVRGGRFPRTLKRALDQYPVVTHGLTMGFGATSPHEREYVAPLVRLLKDVDTPWHSDHLCFSGSFGIQSHDLLPLPLDSTSLSNCELRIREAQEQLERPVAFENVSYYAPCGDPLAEAEMCRQLLLRTGCYMLLDVNNILVNSKNHGFDPKQFVDRIPGDRVVQLHVAGHRLRPDGLRIDTHGEPVCDEVYELLDYTLGRLGPKPILLERDTNIPPLSAILEEVERLQTLHRRHVEMATAREHGAVVPIPSTANSPAVVP